VKRVVLLHSALGDSRLWRAQVAALEGRFEVIAPDLPGFGDEPFPEGPFSYVDRVAQLLPAMLVGNSFGGAVALQTALAHPDRVERLVLASSALPGWTFGEEMQANWEQVGAAVDAGDLDAAAGSSVDFWVAPPYRDFVLPQQLRALEHEAARAGPEPTWPDAPPLSSLRMPTLVVVGADDKADFRAIARHLAGEIHAARLVEVPGAGHLVGVEQPERLNELLLDFLSGEAAG
jgi:3-oxoadipate enol-lactonase